MKIRILAITILAISNLCYSQDTGDEQIEYLRGLYKNKEYDKVISFKPKRKVGWNSKSLYYVGMSFYMKYEDQKALEYLNKAIDMGPADHDMYFYKGKMLFYMESYEMAIPVIKKSIELKSDEPDFYRLLAEAFSASNEPDSTVFYLRKAAGFDECNPRVYMMLGEIYGESNYKEALDYFVIAKSKLDQDDENHRIAWVNIGLYQQKLKNFDESENTYRSILEKYPNDYLTMNKLIQVLIDQTKYEEVVLWKNRLYEAHKENNLPEMLAESFCFEQFEWNGKNVMGFEYYAEPNGGSLCIKHSYYVIDYKGDIEIEIMSETSASIRSFNSNTYYILAKKENGNLYSYWQCAFDEDVQYSELKECVLKILNNEISPESSTIKN